MALRRARASLVVIGAGATGPRRLALSRLGVGRPLGAVPDVITSSVVSTTGVVSTSLESPSSFLRPNSFTLPGYLGYSRPRKCTCRRRTLICTDDGRAGVGVESADCARLFR